MQSHQKELHGTFEEVYHYWNKHLPEKGGAEPKAPRQAPHSSRSYMQTKESWFSESLEKMIEILKEDTGLLGISFRKNHFEKRREG
jgi:hypothetical protein